MMSPSEFSDHLDALRLAPPDAAQLLGVSERSVRRWADGEAVPGPVEAALRAWRALDGRHLPWKPDSISILQDDQDQMQRMEQYDQTLEAVLSEVEARGGPQNPWTVDIAGQRATFGPSEVGFYILRNGGFSPNTYRRLDRTPREDDKPDIQDAVYCIAQAFSTARQANAAMLAVAEYIRQNGKNWVRSGPAMPTAVEAARREQQIAMVADRLGELALSALGGEARYAQFESLLDDLHRLGFFPDIALVSAVARSMVGIPRAGIRPH